MEIDKWYRSSIIDFLIGDLYRPIAPKIIINTGHLATSIKSSVILAASAASPVSLRPVVKEICKYKELVVDN